MKLGRICCGVYFYLFTVSSLSFYLHGAIFALISICLECPKMTPQSPSLSTSLCVSSSRHLADCLLRAETSWGSLPGHWAFLISLMPFLISLCALSALESTSGAFKNIIQLHYDAALTRRKCSTMLSIVMRIVLSPFASSPAFPSAFSSAFSDLSSTEKFKFQSYIKRIKQEGWQSGRPLCQKRNPAGQGAEVVGVVYYKSLDGRLAKGSCQCAVALRRWVA